MSALVDKPVIDQTELDKADLAFHRAHYASCQVILSRLGVPLTLPNGKPMTVLQRILRIEKAVTSLWPEKRGKEISINK